MQYGIHRRLIRIVVIEEEYASSEKFRFRPLEKTGAAHCSPKARSFCLDTGARQELVGNFGSRVDSVGDDMHLYLFCAWTPLPSGVSSSVLDRIPKYCATRKKSLRVAKTTGRISKKCQSSTSSRLPVSPCTFLPTALAQCNHCGQQRFISS
jgi:hypothetical protein